MSRSPHLLACAVLGALLAAAPAAAQLSENLGSLSGDNAKGYLHPLNSALSGTMNAAIFQTGKVPKASPSFQIGVRVMGVTLPDDERTYRPTPPPGFTPIEDVQAPTVTGSGTAVAQQGQGGTTLYHPGGFDIGEFAFAAPQLSVGGLFGTRLVARWISVELGDSDLGSFDLFGVGAQHSISQYVPAMPFDLAAGLFYQSFSIDDDLVKSSALHLNVTASKSFGLVQPYLGVGYDTFELEAEYEDDTNPGNNIAVKLDKKSNAHLTLGLMVGFPVVKLYAEGNIAAANGAAVGLSFGN
uniref:Transporter n=1 Tax=Eiseniibacteriota bacterium TaxID=2212470 RepID=A0A832I6B7_UNCEI